MKKLLYTSLLLSGLFICLCKTNNGFEITAGIKTIINLSNVLPLKKSDKVLPAEENKTAKADRKISPILPAYFWDTKMMTW